MESKLTRVTGDSLFARLEEAYRDHRDRLVTFAAAFLGDKALAEDVVHDVFAMLAKEPERMASIANPGHYLTVCARNGALAVLRRKKRRGGIPPAADDQSPPTADPAQMASRTEENGTLLRLVASLPDDLRAVLTLRIWGELSFKEIAEMGGVSKGTAHGRYVQALERLRHALARGVRDE